MLHLASGNHCVISSLRSVNHCLFASAFGIDHVPDGELSGLFMMLF